MIVLRNRQQHRHPIDVDVKVPSQALLHPVTAGQAKFKAQACGISPAVITARQNVRKDVAQLRDASPLITQKKERGTLAVVYSQVRHHDWVNQAETTATIAP